MRGGQVANADKSQSFFNAAEPKSKCLNQIREQIGTRAKSDSSLNKNRPHSVVM